MKFELRSGSSIYTIGERIKIARKQKGITSQELANLIDRSRSFVATYENDERNPKDNVLKMIADALDVNFLYLKNGDSIISIEDSNDILIRNYYVSKDYIKTADKNNEDYKEVLDQILGQLLDSKEGDYNYGKILYEVAMQLEQIQHIKNDDDDIE